MTLIYVCTYVCICMVDFCSVDCDLVIKPLVSTCFIGKMLFYVYECKAQRRINQPTNKSATVFKSVDYRCDLIKSINFIVTYFMDAFAFHLTSDTRECTYNVI